ncbi:MAG: hypothetical protein JNK15_01030, partial [Planctomycetes bacterium]|nr:hypothetical protein [Planctomycetota bacterium]
MDKKLVWLVVAALLTGGVVAQAGYTFTLDGREESLVREGLRVRGGIVSLRGDSERPVAGDLAWISARATCLVRLEAPGRYEFTDEFEAAGRLLLRHDQGSRVAVVDSTRLVAADAATRAALLGVVVDRWDAEVADALAKLAPTVPLVVTDGAAIGAERA